MDRSASKSAQADAASRLVNFCLHLAYRINKAFYWVTATLQVLLLPQWTNQQYRVYMVYSALVCSHDLLLVSIAKSLQVYYHTPNFMLLMSLGSLLPFLRVVHNLWTFIPCPPMAAVISNLALALVLGILLLLGVGTLKDGWVVYVYVMTSWPWLVLVSMVSRLYIERSSTKNPFSPVRELPVHGLMSAGAYALTMMAAKEISVTDCVVLSCLDPIFAAIVCSVLLGSARRRLHFRNVKVYAIILILAALYRVGEFNPGALLSQAATPHHGLFALARFVLVCRSALVKYQYASFYNAESPIKPPENELLFYSDVKQPKHRFRKFPSPVLLTLDCLFDSGLRDSEFHGMGPLGTQDLLLITELTYLLPISSILAWIYERDTLKYGVMPPQHQGQDAFALVTVADSASMATHTVREAITSMDVAAVSVMVVAFCAARMLNPWATAKSLFDRGSPAHAWQYQPIIVAVPFFFWDVLYLNGSLSKFQIVIVLLLGAVVAHYRSGLWNNFKRKYLLLCTQELQYYQPSVLRALQRKTLVEFLDQTSTEDYGFMLLETSIRHGANIRELARDISVTVWDPSATATAAWKLAFSLVTKALKKHKASLRKKTVTKQEAQKFVEGLVLSMVYNAVDEAEGHGKRLEESSHLSSVVYLRKAIRRLRQLAIRRRTLRAQRKTGQLALAPATLATAGGMIRSVRDMVAQQPMLRLEPPPAPVSPLANRSSVMQSPAALPPQQETLHLSLTSSHELSRISGVDGPESSFPTVPGVLSSESCEVDKSGSFSGTGSTERGVWSPVELGGSIAAHPSSTAVVLAFGDVRRGQLGVDAAGKALHGSHTVVLAVEELRGCEPVQVEAAGVGSFVVGARGQVWGFGSNRSMELGLRKEVTQINAPQRIKSIRESAIVQVSGSCSASGQSHTIALTSAGEVYTFGMSSRGALGHGPEVRQTAPLLLRMTTQVSIRLVAAGARHSLLLSDAGKLYTFGDNTHGQLGIGTCDQKGRDTPLLVGGELEALRVKLLGVGDDHTLAYTEDARLFAWGANANGQLGIGRLDDKHTPEVMRDFPNAGIISLAGGARHSLIVTGKGCQVWACGSNVQGQLGIGMEGPECHQRAIPILVQALSGQRVKTVVQVAAAASHSLALTSTGEVYGFGDNTHGQLGFTKPNQGNAMSQRLNREADIPRAFAQGATRVVTPTRVPALSLYRVQAVSTADMHSLALAA